MRWANKMSQSTVFLEFTGMNIIPAQGYAMRKTRNWKSEDLEQRNKMEVTRILFLSHGLDVRLNCHQLRKYFNN